MKTLLYITIIIALGGACRSTKEKQRRDYQENQSATNSQLNRSFYLQNNHDSLWRYWYYIGDTPFYFHPDSGVYAIAGEVLVQEHKLGRQFTVHVNDSSLLEERHRQLSGSEQLYRSVRQEWLLPLATGMVILIAVAYVLRWRRI